MGKILDTIKEINEKNSIEVRRKDFLTRHLFEKILRGLIAEKAHTLLASELGINRGLINDVIDEFEIDNSGKARRVLNALSEEKDESIDKPLWLIEKQAPKKTNGPVVPTKAQVETPKKLGPFNRELAEQRQRQQRGNSESKVPDDIERKFKNDIFYGFRRMQVLYGEGSDLNLSDEELTQEILMREPDVKTRDAGYFEDKKFTGE